MGTYPGMGACPGYYGKRMCLLTRFYGVDDDDGDILYSWKYWQVIKFVVGSEIYFAKYCMMDLNFSGLVWDCYASKKCWWTSL